MKASPLNFILIIVIIFLVQQKYQKAEDKVEIIGENVVKFIRLSKLCKIRYNYNDK